MVAVKVSAFGGMIPAQDDTLLPENNSASNENVYLNAGSLQGMRTPRLLHAMVNPAYKYAFRLPLSSPDKNHILSSYWVEFPDADTNVLRSQVANDSFSRFYFACPSDVPRYNTKARMLAGSSSYILGIPAPSSAPALVVVGGSGTTIARSYVTTWVSAYGEEGPPSPPVLLTGFVNGSWNLTIPAPGGGDTTGRNLTKTRIYRTITDASGGTTYFMVVEIAIGTLSYNDTLSDVSVSANSILESVDYGSPPTDLKGIVSMPNGMFVGFRGNEIWFCEPFKPHAWPAAYTSSIDAQIVGLGVVGQTVVVLTDGFPYAASGISPANMAFSKIATFEPCLSRGSIVSTAQGVFYASPNGVVLAAYGVVQNASQQLATKDRWQEMVRPETLRATRLGAAYYAWGTTVFGSFEPTAFQAAAFEQYDYTGAYTGAVIDLVDPRIAWSSLSHDDSATDNVMTDMWSGEIFLMRGGNVMWQDVTSSAVQGPYRWRSKQYQLAQGRNLAAMRVWFEELVNDPAFVLNPVRNTASPQTLAADQYGLVRVFVDGTLVMTRELRGSGELLRLPSGFKNVHWQFEIEARVKVLNFEAASTVKELSGV